LYKSVNACQALLSKKMPLEIGECSFEFLIVREWLRMRRKEVRLAGILFVGMTLCLGACQSGAPAKSEITDPNTVFAQGGARADTSGTPARGAGRRSRAQSPGPNAGAGND
jgi:hypothetical protein